MGGEGRGVTGWCVGVGRGEGDRVVCGGRGGWGGGDRVVGGVGSGGVRGGGVTGWCVWGGG